MLPRHPIAEAGMARRRWTLAFAITMRGTIALSAETARADAIDGNKGIHGMLPKSLIAERLGARR